MLTRKATSYIKANKGKYKWMPKNQTFDLFDDNHPFYDLKLGIYMNA